MGQIVRRKRRGRPSNTDRARINYSPAPPSPMDRRRSRRRRNVRYNFDIDDYVDDDEFYDDEDEEVGRREKKLRLLLCEDDSRSNTGRVRHAPASSSSDDYDEDEDFKYSMKRKISGGDAEDDEDNEFEEIRGQKLEEEDDEDQEQEGEEEEEEEAPGSDFVCGAASDLSKGIPLPDKKTLELILDKLQKKDTYGVYAEPVDPDELPDYHDVIKRPMDFATVRKKLAKGAYSTLKEFESDVLLICTNAMQYNAPDTIYYKQASSIQEQAKLRFQRLRANVDRFEIEPNTEHKIRPSFSPPKKQLKKPVGRPVQDPIGSETLSGGANATNVRIEEFPNCSSAQTPVRPDSSEVLIAENSSLPDNGVDKEHELVPGKGCMSKLGRKPVYDENRRATYKTFVEPVTESESIFSMFEGESKQFIPVGLHVDHSYARSLARFAATLGSVAWKVASQTIEQALPTGVKFGRGWVGEYEPLPTQVLIMPGNYTEHFEKKPCRSNNRSPKPTLGTNVRIPLKQQSLKEPVKDPKPPFFSSNLSASNLELNPPPPIITRKPAHSGSDIPSPRPASRNGNLVSLPSFKHPNHNNDGFAPARPSKGNPTPVSREQQQPPLGLCDPVEMMKTLAERGQSQQTNSNSFNFGLPKREDINGSKRESSNVGLPAAQAWMSLGGTHKQQQNSVESLYNNRQQQQPPPPQASRFQQNSVESLYNNRQQQQPPPPQASRFQQNSVESLYNNRQQQQPQSQASRFRGEVQFQGDKNAYQQNPIQAAAFVPGNIQNRHVGFPQLVTADLSRFQVQQPSWRGVTPQMQQLRPKQQESRPPDLNIGYHQSSPVRQSTGMLVDSQQPDLALQL